MLRQFVRIGAQVRVNSAKDFARARLSCPYTTKGDNEDETSKNVVKTTDDESKSVKRSPFSALKRNISNIKERIFQMEKEAVPETRSCMDKIPPYCDVLVIGGGAIGSSIAYWLKHRMCIEEFRVVVVERDPTYSKASTALSAGGLRQQFSLEENVEMSLFGAEFLRNINHYLGIPNEPPIDLCFHPYGYLTLASEQGAEILRQNSEMQNALGAKNVILSKHRLQRTFPWMNVDGIDCGCLGLEKEGWFDPWSLLSAFRNKASSLGVHFVHGEVTGFNFSKQMGFYVKSGPNPDDISEHERLNSVIVQSPDGETKSIQFSSVVVAAGAFSSDVTKMAKIGEGYGLLSIPLPVEPRKRYVYCFHCPDGPNLNTPLTIDPSGAYFRRDGLLGNYISGKSPLPEEEPETDNLDVDHDYFENTVWPIIAHRVKTFENLKVKSSWAGYYEYNTFDANGIVGRHPFHENMYIATGFSGHGIQQAPAVGRAIAELILDKKFVTLDLSNLGFERFVLEEPMRERNIV